MAHLASDGFIDVDDAEKVAELRQKWLEAERQALAEFKLGKLGQEAFSGDAFKGQSLVAADHTDPLHAGREMIVKRPVVDFQSPDEADENHLKHPGMGRSALQSLNLFVGHVLILLRLRKPAGVVDPAQAKPEKGAA